MQLRKWMPTIIMVAILLLGGAYAYSQNFFQQDQTAPVEAKWITFTPANVQQIEMKSLSDDAKATTTPSSITLENKQNQWQMRTPASYPTNAYAITDWLTTLQAATVHAIVENQPTDVAKYGIDTKQPTIVLTSTDGKQDRLYIGSKLPTDGYYYARLNEGAIIQLSQQTVTDLSATVFSFVDTTPFGWDDQYMTALSWAGQDQDNQWTLKHQANLEDPSQDRWTFNGHSISSEQASNLTDSIKNIPTDQLPQPASQLSSKSPVFTLEVTRKEGKRTVTETYQGFQSPDNSAYIEVVDPAHQWAYRLPSESIKQVIQAAQAITSSSDHQ
ncbi:DUF4340 domain-containing protein [Paenibacillus sp. KACC 21273]|uniref:DUF4340 domain-containing protein n=1 Tax=Paenibacillus sp. KACC 21273 TaxID=3025665 RepID=UPI0023673369|nr:DUF4340 domain-containing protein [Paenibacillus sp. KACC 21273]WDF51885.1 DUF4340 domain-containing protein [Paenibacillus sp. KACC 21273]